MTTEYSSDRFVHDQLLRRCEAGLEELKEIAQETGIFRPTIILWPEEPVSTITGKRFSGVVFKELPDAPEERKQHIRGAVDGIRPFGILVVEQFGNCVRAIFESRVGTRTWRFPLQNFGGTKTLGAPAVRDNAESVGVLWTLN